MKIFKKEAEIVAILMIHGERVLDYRCPNKNCGMGVAEDYICCPHCGQRIKFNPDTTGMTFKKFKFGGEKYK